MGRKAKKCRFESGKWTFWAWISLSKTTKNSKKLEWLFLTCGIVVKSIVSQNQWNHITYGQCKGGNETRSGYVWYIQGNQPNVPARTTLIDI